MRKYPRIYDAHMRTIGDLRTAEYTDLKLRQTPFDSVTLTVPTADVGGFGYRQFVELYDEEGKRIDMFRVVQVPKKTYAPSGMTRMTCDQVLCTLKDGIIPGYHQFGGSTQSLREAINAVLAFQTEPLWELDRCDYDTHLEYGVCDESPYTALLMLIEPLSEAMITTDTTTRPWKLSVVRMTDEDASEIRFSRNMLEIEETIQDGDFATRLYPRGYGEGVNQLTIRDVNGGVEYIEAPQAVRDTWGTVSLPYIDTTITDALTLKTKAAAALDLCQTPHVSYKVSALDIERLTGEPMDRFYKGRMVRMIYRDFGLVVRTRITEVHKPKPTADPSSVKLTLSTQPESVASIIADLARKTRINDVYGQGSTFIYSDSIEQNCDKNTPAEGDIYIPESMIHVNAVMLKVTVTAFRADSKSATGGGGKSTTSKSGGGGSSTAEDKTSDVELYTGNPIDDDGISMTQTDAAGAHDCSGSVGNHRHKMIHGHKVTGTVKFKGFSVKLPEHTHDVEIPDHDHDIEFGIYKGPTVSAYTVSVDGNVVPDSAFDGGVADIAPYLSADAQGRITRGTYHTVTVTPTANTKNTKGLCRIRASWNAQVFISSLTGTQR